MLKNLKLQKNLITLSLAISANAFSQTISNGDFESYSSLPSCSTGHDITLATGWRGIRIDPNLYHCDIITTSSSPSADYFYTTVTSACQNGSGPHGGDGYALGHDKTYVGFYDVIYQPIIGTLTHGSSYVVNCYVRDFSTTGPYNAIYYFRALLVNQSVGSSASAIGNNVHSQNYLSGPVPANLTSVGGGWYLFQQTITVPATGSYYLVLGDSFVCNDFDSDDYVWGIDDVTFQKPCVTYNSVYYQANTSCCGPPVYDPAEVAPTFLSSCCTGVNWVDCTDPNQPTSNDDQLDFVGGSWGSDSPKIDMTRGGTVSLPDDDNCKTYCISASGSCCGTVFQTIRVCLGTNPPENSCCRIAASVTAINNTKSEKVGVHPNPASKILSLDLPSSTESVKIYNFEGRKVFETTNVNESNITIDVSQFNKGVYFLSAVINSGIQNIKIVIE